jgi:O-antigen ligase
MDEWTRSSAMNWLFGLGFGASWSLFNNYPHVVMIQVLGELGIIGLCLYFVFYSTAAISWFKFVKLAKSDTAIRATAVVFGAFALFEFVLSFKQGGISGAHAFWVFPAILVRCAQIAKRSTKHAYRQHRRAIVPRLQPTIN